MRTTDTLKTTRSLKDFSLEIGYTAYFRAALLYLTIPVLIFFVGYLKIWWALLFTALTVFAGFMVLRNLEKNPDGTQADTSKFSIKLDFKYLAVIIPLILLTTYIAGVGEFAFSSGDHTIRYAILHDLVNYKWPVIYDLSTQQNPTVSAYLGEGEVAFAYYFVFWMVPAVIGKVAGLLVARIALFIWSALGIFLVTIGASMLYGKASKALYVGMILWAGFDVIPYYINTWAGVWTTWERWNAHLIVVGNFYQLMNVFNQSIPGWIITILLIMAVNGSSIGFLGALMFCYSPWAAIGIAPMCVTKLITKRAPGNPAAGTLKALLTPGNLIAPVIFFISLAPFYTANSNATGDSGFILNFYPSVWIFIKDYLAFIVLEFGVWFALIYRFHKKDPMLLTALVTMLIIPFYKITYANDFLMRGSMAPMFLISLYAVFWVTDNFHKCLGSKKFELKPRLAVLALIIAAYTTINLLLYSSIMTAQIRLMGDTESDVAHNIESFGNIRKADEVEVINTQFFVYNYEDTIFFKYLAK